MESNTEYTKNTDKPYSPKKNTKTTHSEFEDEINKLRPNVKELVLNTEDGLGKWKETLYSYGRLTFVIEDRCTVCYNSPVDTKEKHTDDTMGYINLYGWKYCKECEPFVELAIKDKEIKAKHLFKYTYMWLDEKILQFWRKSRSDPNKLSYMERHATITSNLDVINIHKNRIVCNVKWNNKDSNNKMENILNKITPLSNIICFNRSVMGYNISDCKFINRCTVNDDPEWIKLWIDKFKIEYQIADTWDIAKLILNRVTNLPKECHNNILDYVGDLYNI